MCPECKSDLVEIDRTKTRTPDSINVILKNIQHFYKINIQILILLMMKQNKRKLCKNYVYLMNRRVYMEDHQLFHFIFKVPINHKNQMAQEIKR